MYRFCCAGRHPAQGQLLDFYGKMEAIIDLLQSERTVASYIPNLYLERHILIWDSRHSMRVRILQSMAFFFEAVQLINLDSSSALA